MEQRHSGTVKKPHSAIVHAGIRIVICILIIVCGCNRRSESRTRIELVDTPVPMRAVQSTPQKPNLPNCLDGDVTELQPGTQGTGDHSVILSWNASTSAQSHPNDFGYCVYRGKAGQAIKPNPQHHKQQQTVPCVQCERVNVVPVTDIGCVDTIVMDNTTYYYAAATISRNGYISDLSKQISPFVPGSNVPRKTISTQFKSCRQWDPPTPASPAATSSRH